MVENFGDVAVFVVGIIEDRFVTVANVGLVLRDEKPRGIVLGLVGVVRLYTEAVVVCDKVLPRLRYLCTLELQACADWQYLIGKRIQTDNFPGKTPISILYMKIQEHIIPGSLGNVCLP